MKPAELLQLNTTLLELLSKFDMKRIEAFRGSRMGVPPTRPHWVGGYCVGMNSQEYTWQGSILVPVPKEGYHAPLT